MEDSVITTIHTPSGVFSFDIATVTDAELQSMGITRGGILLLQPPPARNLLAEIDALKARIVVLETK